MTKIYLQFLIRIAECSNTSKLMSFKTFLRLSNVENISANTSKISKAFNLSSGLILYSANILCIKFFWKNVSTSLNYLDF